MSGGGTSIDDLLGYEDEAAYGAPRHGPVAATVRALLLAAAITGGIVLALRIAEFAVPVPLVAVGVLALVALRRVVRAVAPGGAGRRRPPPHQDTEDWYAWSVPDAMRRAVLRWEHRLAWHADTHDAFAVQLQPVLREVADERLRLGYGVTIGSDPARARVLLGEPLWAVLTGQWRRGPDAGELARAVADLERLPVEPDLRTR
jgi:hypothetical protein